MMTTRVIARSLGGRVGTPEHVSIATMRMDRTTSAEEEKNLQLSTSEAMTSTTLTEEKLSCDQHPKRERVQLKEEEKGLPLSTVEARMSTTRAEEKTCCSQWPKLVQMRREPRTKTSLLPTLEAAIGER